MHKAGHQGIKKKLAQLGIRRLLKRQFAGIHVRGCLDIVQRVNEPVLYYANHVSLWDFSVASYLTYFHLGQDPYVMAAEYTFLPMAAWAGAYSVNPNDSFSVVASIKYSVELLKSVEHCGLWMFPQGAVSPALQRPLDFRSGTALIVRQVQNLILVPVVFSYNYVNHVQPEVFVDLGEPHSINRSGSSTRITSDLEDRITQRLDTLLSDLSQRKTDEFGTVLEGSRDVRYYLFRMRHKAYPPLKRWGAWY
jgi:1-acyl-sn-glycerol-3-phosphate acyltransferase